MPSQLFGRFGSTRGCDPGPCTCAILQLDAPAHHSLLSRSEMHTLRTCLTSLKPKWPSDTNILMCTFSRQSNKDAEGNNNTLTGGDVIRPQAWNLEWSLKANDKPINDSIQFLVHVKIHTSQVRLLSSSAARLSDPCVPRSLISNRESSCRSLGVT